MIVSTANMTPNVSSKEMRGQRLKRLRKITGLSRKDFALRYQISPGTLQNWETARFGGLSEKGAHMMITAFKTEGVFCSFEWLMYQAGHGPKLDHMEQPSQTGLTSSKNTSTANEDLAVFLQNNPNAVHLWVEDQTMAPYFQKGILVAGTKKTGNGLSECIGHVCITQIQDQSTPVLRLITSASNSTFKLIHLNPLAPSNTSLTESYSLIYCAPIEWMHRGKL